jgi:hypothetical protein
MHHPIHPVRQALARISTDSFTDFFSIGGQIIGDPTAVVVNEGVQVFARSINNVAITNLVISRSFPSQFVEIPGLTIYLRPLA